ncbi:MAG: hypothetical protein ACR2RL_12815, partial [Gammaproteobacteria bacterium]
MDYGEVLDGLVVQGAVATVVGVERHLPRHLQRVFPGQSGRRPSGYIFQLTRPVNSPDVSMPHISMAKQKRRHGEHHADERLRFQGPLR